MKIQTSKGLGVFAAALLLQACTGFGGLESKDPVQAVTARAESRWMALIDGRLETAYEYLSPASREALPFAMFQKRVKAKDMWREAKVKSVTCDAEFCRAKVWLKYDIHNIKGLELEFDESWIKQDGSWWYVQKK